MEFLTLLLVREARRLGLAGQPPHLAPSEALLALGRLTLQELIAQGALPDPEPDIDCWAAPRHPGH
ncbi:hypothetical protein LAJ19_00745 [Deinococcus taeanensis]|uniref:hypothetical protein n=1 Tax=Deinococcus taeanensis TaxID=2737050 RepID=UPI001CDBE5DE|nr:hypothetical protein [Deinococcus taeanensis]UBV42798.1 hypothetical protein LAJ19_00745 [Deinococcus taeanensis]